MIRQQLSAAMENARKANRNSSGEKGNDAYTDVGELVSFLMNMGEAIDKSNR